MKRRHRIPMIIAALSLAWCAPLVCRAQTAAPPARGADATPLPQSTAGMITELPVPAPHPTDQRFPINLATALRLADGRPLIVAAAQASAWVAEARLQRAKVIGVPDLNLGFDYTRHDGLGPDTLRG